MDAEAPGVRAIEIAATFGDTVVNVKHLSRPRSGRPSALTMALFAIGALGILAAALAFAHAVSIARDNDDALHRVDLRGRSAIDLRPRRPWPGLDFVVVGGIVGGMLCVAVGLARARGELESPCFRVGRGRRVEHATHAIGDESFALVSPAGDDFQLSWTDGMRGEMIIGEQVTPLEWLPRSFAIPHNARIRVEAGMSRFFVSSVAAPRATATGLRVDGTMLGFALASLAWHLALVALLHLIPDDTRGYFDDRFDGGLRRTRVSIVPPEAARRSNGGGEGPATPGDPGDPGNQRAPGGPAAPGGGREPGHEPRKLESAPRLAAAPVPPETDPDRGARARSAGILAVLADRQRPAFAEITALGGGLDLQAVRGSLAGSDSLATAAGGWGFDLSAGGPRGDGPGGPGIGKARYGTIGDGPGTGPSFAPGLGPGGPRGRIPRPPKLAVGEVLVGGGLDRNTIRRYVRQKLESIQYCYQRQLTVRPALAGTVDSEFTIDENGRVIAARTQGLGDPEVEACIAEVLRSIAFPRPHDGSLVHVRSYPFILHPAGD